MKLCIIFESTSQNILRVVSMKTLLQKISMINNNSNHCFYNLISNENHVNKKYILIY